MKYRKEIDGLRALAILPVILFHAGFSTFSGGFIGVDVFFVISGYLITTLILGDLEKKQFSIMGFYERRARRILPALFLMVICLLPVAWFVLPPIDLRDFAKSVLAASTFSSNVLFWLESGYFDSAAELKPLLHTWSLAVEEQYYIFFPVLMILAWRFAKHRLPLLMTTTALASLIFAHWLVQRSPDASFYLLPSRGWELLLGSIVAVRLASGGIRISNRWADVLAGVGVLSILFAVFAYDRNTLIPGVPALVPTIGTALIILCATPNTHVGRLLGNKMLVGIGLISYSAYLWHQPIFAMTRHVTLGTPGLATMLLLCAMSLVVAFLSWKYVETPFRDKARITGRQVFAAGACLSVILAGIGWVGFLNAGFESRYVLPASVSDSFTLSRGVAACKDRPGVHQREDWLCFLGDSRQEPSFVMYGDSHAGALFGVFNEAARRSSLRGAYVGVKGCTPLLAIYAIRPDQGQRNCHRLNERVFEYVRRNGIKKVFLVARWTYYTDGTYSGGGLSFIGLDAKAAKTKEGSRQAFEVGLKQTVDAYAGIGVKLYVVLQVPMQEYMPRNIYYSLYSKKQIISNADLRTYSVPLAQHLRLQSWVRQRFDPFQHQGLLREINFDDILCQNDICMIGSPLHSYYTDDDHLSAYGSSRLLTRVSDALKER